MPKHKRRNDPPIQPASDEQIVEWKRDASRPCSFNRGAVQMLIARIEHEIKERKIRTITPEDFYEEGICEFTSRDHPFDIRTCPYLHRS